MARQVKRETITIDGNLLHETEKGYLFLADEDAEKGEGAAVWLPKSKCEWDEKKSEMEMELWLGKQHGWA